MLIFGPWALIGGLIGIAAAQKKGFHPLGGLLGGVLLGPLALLMFFISGIGGEGPRKKCPFCAEYIGSDAIKCKHCGSMLPATAVPAPTAAPAPQPPSAARAAQPKPRPATTRPRLLAVVILSLLAGFAAGYVVARVSRPRFPDLRAELAATSGAADLCKGENTRLSQRIADLQVQVHAAANPLAAPCSEQALRSDATSQFEIVARCREESRLLKAGLERCVAQLNTETERTRTETRRLANVTRAEQVSILGAPLVQVGQDNVDVFGKLHNGADRQFDGMLHVELLLDGRLVEQAQQLASVPAATDLPWTVRFARHGSGTYSARVTVQ